MSFEQSTVLVITHEGDLDAMTSPSLRAQITDAIDQGVRGLILDLSRVPFIDSSGLGTLVFGLKTVKLQGGDMVITGLQEQAGMIFSITAADRLFEVKPSIAAAEAWLADRVTEA